jgi:hypothetical protein
MSIPITKYSEDEPWELEDDEDIIVEPPPEVKSEVLAEFNKLQTWQEKAKFLSNVQRTPSYFGSELVDWAYDEEEELFYHQLPQNMALKIEMELKKDPVGEVIADLMY